MEYIPPSHMDSNHQLPRHDQQLCDVSTTANCQIVPHLPVQSTGLSSVKRTICGCMTKVIVECTKYRTRRINRNKMFE